MEKSRRKKLLLLDTHPFGTLTDSLKWCQYLRKDYDLTVVCLDDAVRQEMAGVRIVRVGRRFSKKIYGAWFILVCLWRLLFFTGPVMVVYFEHCDLLKRVFPRKKMHIDIRTAGVSYKAENRRVFDARLRASCLRFDSISVISEGVRERLALDKATILPLGADEISAEPKTYDHFSLLYVGGLDRDILKTVIGFHRFLEAHPDQPMHYDIVGHGYRQENDIREYVATQHLQDFVTLHGTVPHTSLKPFFDRCNIGVSFIPMTDYFDHQPPTKTFEYVFSGLFTIATGTAANKAVITEENGCIIRDTAEDFRDALEMLLKNGSRYDSERIRHSLQAYSWPHIVDRCLCPVLRKLA